MKHTREVRLLRAVAARLYRQADHLTAEAERVSRLASDLVEEDAREATAPKRRRTLVGAADIAALSAAIGREPTTLDVAYSG